MEARCFQLLEEDGVRSKVGGPEDGGRGAAASSPDQDQDQDQDQDSDSDGDSEQEPPPPPVVRRRVSFADAFGLDLVSVKEFDEAEAGGPEAGGPPRGEQTGHVDLVQLPLEQVHMSCLFAVPSSPEELEQRLQEQMVELESVELLRGTSTLRGVVRVLNLCYHKGVYVRITLDGWSSSFDLPAQYVPGSSDMKTDRFSFHYTLVPPFQPDGSRLEFCLRYETSMGTFWANNRGMNYVVFCHHRDAAAAKEQQRGSRKGNRSCLKAKRRGCAEARESILMAALAAEAVSPYKAEEASEIHALLKREELKPLVANAKTRQRAARLARVQDHFYQKTGRVSRREQAGLQPPWADPAHVLHHLHQKPAREGQQVLTYHQIPLYTLDWSSERSQSGPNVDDLWSEGAKLTFSKALEAQIKDASSATNIWKSSLTDQGEASVGEVWRAFLDGPSFSDDSSLPESEWLQTAASVSPSVDKDLPTRRATSNPDPEPPGVPPARTSTCRPPPDAQEASLANGGDGQRAEITATGGVASTLMNQMNSSPDSCRRETPGAEGPGDVSAGGQELDVQEQKEDRRQEGDEGSRSDAGKSSEEPGKAGADVWISEGSSLEEEAGRRREEVTSTINGVDATLAFVESKDSETRAGEEDGIATDNTGGRTQRGGGRFSPQKPEQSERSPRNADVQQREETRMTQNTENRFKRDEKETNVAPPRAGGAHPKQVVDNDNRTAANATKDETQSEAAADEYVEQEVEEEETSNYVRREERERTSQEVDEAPTGSEEIKSTEAQSAAARVRPEEGSAGTQEPITVAEVEWAGPEVARLEQDGLEGAGLERAGIEEAGLEQEAAPLGPPPPHTDCHPGLSAALRAEERPAARWAELPERLAPAPKGRGRPDPPPPEPLRRHVDAKHPGSREQSAGRRAAPHAEPTGLSLWRLLHILSQVTRLLMGGALVGGVCVVVLLHDFPAILVLYGLTLCWWFYTWRRHARAAKTGMVG